MSDIFISYAREDRKSAEKIARALEAQGWSVWWDWVIPTGRKFRRVIEEEINKARCVVVLWSATSIEKDWVIEEAAEGNERGILLPVRIEKVRPPVVPELPNHRPCGLVVGGNFLACFAPLSRGACGCRKARRPSWRRSPNAWDAKPLRTGRRQFPPHILGLLHVPLIFKW